MAIIVPILMLLLLAAADFARLFYVSIEVNSAARAGAQYGSQTVMTAADISGMIAAAQADGSNVNNLSVTATQCTCGPSLYVAACPPNYCASVAGANFIEVDTQAPFHTLVNYPGIPSSVTVYGKAIMQVQQ
jgi:Flp pilus assembly protein TadG